VLGTNYGTISTASVVVFWQVASTGTRAAPTARATPTTRTSSGSTSARTSSKPGFQRGEDADGVLADVPLARAHGAAKALDKKISDLRRFRQTLQTADVPDKREQVNTGRVS
jgi:hypothetical protein